jgi:hypothetical protein
VRTDLDSFSDVEAYTLMTSAYRMTEHEFRLSKCIENVPDPPQDYNWKFLAVEEGMKGSGAKYEYLLKQLGASSSLAFKVWMLSKGLKITSWLLAVAAVVLAAWAWFHFAPRTVVNLTVWDVGKYVATTIAVAIGVYVLGKTVMRVVQWRETVTLIILAGTLSTLGFVAAWLHLLIFDPLFLRQGNLASFKRQE